MAEASQGGARVVLNKRLGVYHVVEEHRKLYTFAHKGTAEEVAAARNRTAVKSSRNISTRERQARDLRNEAANLERTSVGASRVGVLKLARKAGKLRARALRLSLRRR